MLPMLSVASVAQTAGFTDGGGIDAFAPLSLIPNVLPSDTPARRAGSFERVIPSEEVPAVATEQPPIAAKKQKQADQPSVAAVQDEAAVEMVAVPMPPRRPFDLRAKGKKDKVLLAKLVQTEEPAVGSMTRSLTAIQKVPQNSLTANDEDATEQPRTLKRLASLPGVRSDIGGRSDLPGVEPIAKEKSYLVPTGGSFAGIVKQTPSVKIGCFGPDLLSLLRRAGKHFGTAVVVTSGLRAGGRRGSYHKKCMAADIKLPGISKQRVAAFLRTLPDAGGVGLYCHNDVVHIDTAEPRNWTYCGFRRTSFSLRNGGWNSGKHARAGQSSPDDSDE
jgi:hypothetical protein